MAYFGPEVVAPLASLAAGLAGVAMMFWRRIVAALKRTFRWATRPFRKGSAAPTERPGPERP